MTKLMKVPLIGKYAQSYISNNLALFHEILVAFLNCSWEIILAIESFPFPKEA
jgi:hypothetical protein